METSTNDREIVELERAFWQALKDGDLEGALRLSEDPCIVVGPQGQAAIDKKTFAAMSKDPTWKLLDFEFVGQPSVMRPSPDVAVIAYKVREEMTVEGKPLTLEAADASTWVRQGGAWKCVLHSEAILGDSFGRDRISKTPTQAPLAQQDAVANLAVKDLKKARKFYEETVGLTPVHAEGEEAVVYKSGSSTVNVYRSDFAGTNQATALSWAVRDVEEAVGALKSKGVRFEHYDLPEMRREGDVHVSEGTKAAWFKDPDGNILGIMSE